MAKKLEVEQSSGGGARGLAVPVAQVAVAVPGNLSPPGRAAPSLRRCAG